ncbi:MAG: argininosuccinate lyase, partial [Clostridia bacterium]|nr:argininosuccinate lyase [Clostridia bacterium]
ELDDAYSTGSSIMPQKKNPDMAELVRGKTARVYGDMITLFTMMKSLPLAYNKDMQEDKAAVFDAIDNTKCCIEIISELLATLTVKPDKMRSAASGGFINATDCADYLVKKGMPFRDAYKITGKLVAYCIANSKTFETLGLDEYRMYSELFDDDVYTAVDLVNCMQNRKVYGGPSKESVMKQIEDLDSFLASWNRE